MTEDHLPIPEAVPDSTAPASRAPARKRSRLGLCFREVVTTIAPALIIAVVINLFLAQSTVVLGQSMESNLHSNQRIMIEKISYRLHQPQRGDIVVIDVPESSDIPLIKRVIGLPGERVEVRDGTVYIDGTPLQEPYLTEGAHGTMASLIVPAFQVFVMGDNRDASNDSRYFGPVPMEQIVGRAWFSYWPPSEMKVVH
jgi:signal peptidase I